MKKTKTKLQLSKTTIRLLDDLRPIIGGIITTQSASGNTCPTICWCMSEFASDCGSC